MTRTKWRVCSTPGCGTTYNDNNHNGLCHTCRTLHEQARGTSTARGYGKAHRATRTALLPAAIGTPCPLCNQPMQPGQALDLDHTTPLAANPTSTGDRIVHATCNRARRDAPSQ